MLYSLSGAFEKALARSIISVGQNFDLLCSVGKPATFSAGAGGRGGQKSKFLRARAGAGAKSQKSCGRGRARGPKMKNFAGAGGCGRPQGPASPRAGARKKICVNE